MDLKSISTVPRKKARLNKSRTIIKTPTATDYDGNHADEGIRRTAAAHPPPGNSRRHIESNDDGSDSSRFSRGGCSTDGSIGETHNKAGRRGKTEEEKRRQVKERLAEDQRRKDESRSSEGVINADGGGGPICFDGIRIDGYNDPTKERYVNHVVQELGGGRPVGNAKYDEDVDYGARAGEGGKKNYRGRKHQESAMTRQSSSMLSPSKKGGQRMLVGRERVRDRGDSRGEGWRLTYEGSPLFPSSVMADGEDPLDLARSLQEADRRPMSSSALHDIVRATPQKVKHYVTQTMSNVMDNFLQLGSGSMATRRDKLADAASGRRRNPSMEEKRKSTADAALERRTADKPSGHPLPMGEKRKWTHQFESREGRHAPTKRNERCGAIAVDDSIDQSTGENGQGDDSVGMTLVASGRWLNTDDISKNTTPPTNFGVKRCPRGNDSVIKNTCESQQIFAYCFMCVLTFYITLICVLLLFLGLAIVLRSLTAKTNNNRRINDIYSHLRGTKKGDDIESIHSMEDLQIRETKSTTHTSNRQISKRDDYGQSRTKKTYGLANQIKRTGMRMIDNFGEEEEWIDTSTKPNIADAQKARPRRRKKSPSSSPQVTDYTVKRNTRSSLKAYAADSGVITIDSSSDEGDDTFLGASNCTSNNTTNGAPEIVAERRASLRQRRAVGDVASIDAVRIAIGKLIFKSKCVLSFQFGTKSPYIQFSFEDKGQMSEHRAYLSGEELKEVKYQIADDNSTSESDEIGETMTVIAFRITPTDQNNLNKFTNSYDQEESDQITGKQYISVEVRDTDDFRAMLEKMRQHPDLGIWCTKESEMEFYDHEDLASASVEKEDNREVTMSSFKEKENISQEVGSQNSSYEGVAAHEKVPADFYKSYSDDPMEEDNDYSMETDEIVSDVI
ncbi:hypothetical protein ACHAW5_002329 [Stephanodiscus triporus]|uniref:Uncharacterized protein n=1 Tax=Stephanodiscus triporus TaxID=2934178 RepID=A0ABD3N352_9STRA